MKAFLWGFSSGLIVAIMGGLFFILMMGIHEEEHPSTPFPWPTISPEWKEVIGIIILCLGIMAAIHFFPINYWCE